MKISDVSTALVRHQKYERMYSPDTVQRTRAFFRQFIDFVGDLNVDDLTTEHIDKYREHFYERRLSPISFYNRVVDIRIFLKFMHMNGWCAIHPDRFPVPKKPCVSKDWLNPDDIRKLIDGISLRNLVGLRDAALISLLASSGVRASEAANLRIEDIGLEGSISVVGKGNKRRVVFVHESTMERIYAYLNAKQASAKSQMNDGRLFGLHRSSVTERVTRWGRKILGKRVYPHMLRHSFATNLSEAEMDVATIAKLMGHSDVATTMMYMHYADGRLRHVYKRHAERWGY